MIVPNTYMVEKFKQCLLNISFDQVYHINNNVANVVTTIGSLLDMLDEAHEYHFFIEKILIPFYVLLESNTICNIVGLDTPSYNDIYAHLQNQTNPLDISSTK